ncbi:MAG: UDP-N-acetylglucosamine 1-carboxyvinyltransferase [Christensenellales bacterium]
MARYVINGGNRLYGDITVKGAKNSALALLSASILTEERVVLRDCPDISDVRNMLSILDTIGCKCSFENGVAVVDSSALDCAEIENKIAKKIRSSVFLLGAMLSRCKKAKIAYPGGCNIGERPIDIHINGLRQLGVEISEMQDALVCDATNATCARIKLKIPSVGATENLIMASVLLNGTTIIENCAREPEVADLQNMLVAMGAKVSGVEQGRVIVEGVKRLHGVDYTVVSDRIVAGTYMIAAAMTKGKVTLHNTNYLHLASLISKLSQYTCNIECKDDKITITGKERFVIPPVTQTGYYPDFPTDLQSQFLAMMSVGKGEGVLVENLFEDRFGAAAQLRLMGADISVDGKIARVKGVERLEGCHVKAGDLRGGAALVLAGLVADGTTVVEDIFHIDRGYENMADVLSKLGADIRRI